MSDNDNENRTLIKPRYQKNLRSTLLTTQTRTISWLAYQFIITRSSVISVMLVVLYAAVLSAKTTTAW